MRTWRGASVMLSSDRQVREQVEALEHHPGLAADLLDVADVAGQLDPVDDDAPGVVLLEAVDAADHRRLARPRRADHHHHLAAGDVEVDPLQGGERAVALDHPDQLDHRLAAAGHLRGVGEHDVAGRRLGGRPRRARRRSSSHSHPQLSFQALALAAHRDASDPEQEHHEHDRLGGETLAAEVRLRPGDARTPRAARGSPSPPRPAWCP